MCVNSGWATTKGSTRDQECLLHSVIKLPTGGCIPGFMFDTLIKNLLTLEEHGCFLYFTHIPFLLYVEVCEQVVSFIVAFDC